MVTGAVVTCPYELVGEADKPIGLTADAGKPQQITA
jgi:hypothetical protein